MLRYVKTGLILLGLFVAAVLFKGLVSVAMDYVWWLVIPVGVGILVLAIVAGLKKEGSEASSDHEESDGTVLEKEDLSH